MPSPLAFTHGVTERFLRYVVIDTQSDPASPTCPSTAKQKDLGTLLARELREIGIADAHLDEHGYVYATIPANTDKTVPVICFCSHMDTSPDCSGTNVKPQIVRNYQGGDIVLPADPAQVIRLADNPALKEQIGNDIITSDARPSPSPASARIPASPRAGWSTRSNWRRDSSNGCLRIGCHRKRPTVGRDSCTHMSCRLESIERR